MHSYTKTTTLTNAIYMKKCVSLSILEHIYCGKVEEDKMNLEVLEEAEKIGLLNLKECSTKVIKDLTTINCVKMMKDENLHRD